MNLNYKFLNINLFKLDKGYGERFGMIWVNFTDPARSVYHKDSAKWYRLLTMTNEVSPLLSDLFK